MLLHLIVLQGETPKPLTKITTVILSKTAYRNLFTKPETPEFVQIIPIILISS